MIKELICISCPMGCHLKVDVENNTVTGNTCKRGAEYGINEVTHPVRVITSTVKIKGGQHSVIPVKTNGAIPKDLNFKCMEVLAGVELQAPVKIGDVVVKDVLGTGIDIIATRNMDAI
ncbi:DUF1667 domain-containing protein [Clostridium taeniosporum]|uniref:DUF1667 domain-containing protein n=1 Tax=Clostridium taeniosporum TaxID=394958 RepID=A0A1D7XJ21_9CLOT|nr:DUF1667 domain-containing protein [Clostridium taeniosporum]AOR23089.1 DUF1667 domain-containing protein [Clostridium taeniosporum]